MSMQELKNLDVTQLQEKEAELRKVLFDLKTQSATDKVKDVSQFQKLRKDIARVQTLLRQHDLSKT